MSALFSTRPATVDEAISGVTKALDNLRHVSTTQGEAAAQHTAIANEAAAKAEAARTEQRRAIAIHTAISGLIGAEPLPAQG